MAQRVLLFPVFDTATEDEGYHVIGWAAFVIDDVVKGRQEPRADGPLRDLHRHRPRSRNLITDPSNDFGVHVITLTK